MKLCNKCKIVKDITEFYKRGKNNYRNECKSCVIFYSKNWIIENGGKFKENRRKYYLSNVDDIKSKSTIYAENNKDRNKITRSNNRYKRQSNYTNRLKNDPLFKLTESIRSSIKSAYQKGGYTKNSRTYEILGCSFIEFKNFIESKFEKWMSWNNYSKYNGEINHGWDFDHIIPISIADCEEDVIKLNHFTNFQPLCSKINRDIKRNKTIWFFQNSQSSFYC